MSPLKVIFSTLVTIPVLYEDEDDVMSTVLCREETTTNVFLRPGSSQQHTHAHTHRPAVVINGCVCL